MSEAIRKKKTTYLLCWVGNRNGKAVAFFEISTGRLCRTQGIIEAGLERGEHRVVAFSDHIHGDDVLNKDELRLVAACFLDESFITHEIDLRY